METNEDDSTVKHEDGLWYCPKCGHASAAAPSLLGHIYTEHWILDDDELPEDFDR